MSVSPPNSYVEIITLKGNGIIRGDAFGRCLSHESGSLVNGITAT